MNSIGRFLKRIAPVAVLASALSFSAWSLYFVSRHLGAPVPVAVVVSTIFDGGALYLADLSADHTREGDSGFGPRMCVWILALASAWLNRLHAVYGHYPTSSELLWMAPPIVAVIIYDLTLRFIHRKTLRATGRIPSSMTRFDTLSWFIFPIKTFKDLRNLVEYRRNRAMLLATGQLMPGTGDQSGRTGDQIGRTGEQLALTAPNPRDVRTWALTAGVPVGKNGPIPAHIESMYREDMSRRRALAAADGQEGEPDSDPAPEPEPVHLADVPRPRALQAVNGHKPTDRESLS